MTERALLMIPGPIEVSAAVLAAAAEPPRSHVAPDLIDRFGAALAAMRRVWLAADDAVPVILAGSGTLAMEFTVQNLVDRDDAVVLVDTGYFSERMGEMLRRRGARVTRIGADPGESPGIPEVDAALAKTGARFVFATHVDTSTGVRTDAEAICALARKHGAMSVFDGVCATAAERFEMKAWGADAYLTASQKAIGLPPGLALVVLSARAAERRKSLREPPPLSLDLEAWLPILRAYEERKAAYFATPATTLVWALAVGLDEILAHPMADRFRLHEKSARALRRAWASLALETVPHRPEHAANTLSALRFPKGVGPELVAAIRQHGVIVAGGLHPAIKTTYFRVGHMGDVLNRPADLERTVRAVARGLADCNAPRDEAAAVAALHQGLSTH